MSRRGSTSLLGALVAGLLLSSSPAAAQQAYIISGRVMDAGGGAAIQGAQVSLRGTGGGGITNNAGAYSFSVTTAPGEYTLEVTFIGRETVTRTVQLAGEANVRVPDIQLRERALELDAVVVTGTAAPTARRAIGNAVSTVGTRELQSTPAQTIDQALQGRVSGAVITSNTGTPGGGVSIRLRGTSSITGGAEPLFIIDGVIVDNNADQQLNLGYRSNASNRLADLDPNDIERIEVLKGAAAAALYGSRANNGVVQIFTRRGRTGEPEITVSSRIGRSELVRRIPFALTPLGFPGGNLNATERVDTVRYDPQGLIFRDGSQMDHHVSLAGGGGDTRYYLSAGYTEDTGIMRGAGHDKLNVRMNVDQGLGNFQLSAGANYIRSNTDLIINGEQGEGGLLTQIVFTPTSRDLTARNPETGRYIFAGGAGPNPLEVLEDWEQGQHVNRFVGSLQGRWAPVSAVTLEYRFGYDNYQMETTQFIPNGSSAAPTGRAVSLNRFSTLINNDLIGSLQWSLGDIALTTSAGMNHTYTQAQNLNATSNELPPGTKLVRGAIQFASQSEVETATLGFFGQQQVGITDRLFLTGALRVDGSSTFGPDERWQAYPKISGSWVVSEEPFLRDGVGDWLSQLRLRAALGYAGNQPPLGSAYARFSRWSGSVNINRAGLVPQAQLGNPNLKPERQREFEIGVDASVLDDRLSAAYTYYNQYTSDLLLSRPFAPSTGVGSRLENVGELSNRGHELQLNTVNVEQGPFRWTSTLIYSRNRNRVEKLEVAPFSAGYTNWVEKGYPIGVHRMAAFQRDANGNILEDDVGPLGTGTANPQIVGNPWPSWTGSFSNEFGLGANWTASFMLDGQFGHELWNQTRRIQDIFGAGPLFDQLIRGEITQAQRARLQGIWENYLEDASFVKLRQVAVRYSTNASWLRNIGARSMQLEVLGRNLHTWTDYSGYDPEINMFGLNTVERGTDFAVYPNARVYTFGVRLTH